MQREGMRGRERFPEDLKCVASRNNLLCYYVIASGYIVNMSGAASFRDRLKTYFVIIFIY